MVNEDLTLDDVARRSGVSRATASRALNDRDGVRDDVRERVKTIAQALGYRPNRAAQNLAGGRASVIGLVVGQKVLEGNPYSTVLIQAVAKAADSHNEGLMLLVDTKEPSESVRNLLRDGLIDGVIISVVATGHQWVEELMDASVPTVLIGTDRTRSDVTVVDVENTESSAQMVEHLFDTGCRRVAMLTGPLEQDDAAQRLAGYRLAHRRRETPVNEDLIVTGDYNRRTGYQQADLILDLKPDAVFCANDSMAVGFYRRATERGVRIPEDLSLAGFDGTSRDEFTDPVLTSIVQPYDKLAEVAVQELITEITGEAEPRTRVVSPQLFYGRTTRTPAD